MLLRDACAAIRSAASDERVVGLVAQLGTAPNPNPNRNRNRNPNPNLALT